MDSRATQVMEDKRADKFRICSQHFSDDQYESTSGQARTRRRRLTCGAVPNQNFGAPASYAPAPLLSMKISAASANPDNVILSKDTAMTIEDTANPLLSDIEMTAEILAASANTDNAILSTDTAMTTGDSTNSLLSDVIMITEKYFVSCETQIFCSSITMATIACQTDFTSVEAACQMEPQCALEETDKSEKIDAYARWPEYEYNYIGKIGKVANDPTYTKAITQSPPLNLLPAHESTPVKGLY